MADQSSRRPACRCCPATTRLRCPPACCRANTRCCWRHCVCLPIATSPCVKTASISAMNGPRRFSCHPITHLHDVRPMRLTPAIAAIATTVLLGLAGPSAVRAAATANAAPLPQTAPAAGHALQPFVASYEAWYGGKPAGTATMRLTRDEAAARWRIDLQIRGERGFAGIMGLNLEQSTVFDEANDIYRPLSQSTVRKAAVLFNRRVTGTYDW